MATLSQAPLIEVATQVRWGVAVRDEEGKFVGYKFSDAEIQSLPSALATGLIDAGFSDQDEFAREFEDVQFALARRYRPAPGQSPICQTGLGVFSVHEVNEQYDWPTYKRNVLRGFDVLLQVLTTFYGEDVPFIGAELQYVDAYFLEEGETPAKFLKNKLQLRIVPPREFREAPFINPEVSSAGLAFQMQLTEPEGVLELSLAHADLAGRPAYIMDTRVRSVEDKVAYTREGMESWLDVAHKVQQHAFRTLINPAYVKTLE